VVPHEFVAAVAADVVEGADGAVAVAYDDDAGVGDGEFFGEVAAGAGEELDASDVEPGALEDRFPLQLIELRRDGVLVRDGSGGELRVVLGPTALSWFGPTRHGLTPLFRAHTCDREQHACCHRARCLMPSPGSGDDDAEIAGAVRAAPHRIVRVA